MFSYVDPTIRERLRRSGRLSTLDRDGQVVGTKGAGAPFLSLLGPVPLPRQIGGREVTLSWYSFVRRVELSKVQQVARLVSEDPREQPEALRELLQTRMSVNSVLACPGFLEHPCPLVRVHSCCMTGDVFGSQRCDCGPQLDGAFERMTAEGGGAVVYMSGHEGRGIGLWAKAVTYLLQDEGQDTYQANISLGLPEDSRDFTEAGVVLRYLLAGRSLRLLGNNELKREHLEAAGQSVAEMVPHVRGVCDHNRRYLRSKRDKGHLLPEL